MATRKPKENDASLPFAALQLLAPPVRLVSAAVWKVMQRRDVMQYGVVEEFVTSACEIVPGLLTVRHQGKLALGLRGRFILELCCTQPDEKVIMPQLERIRAPAALLPSSAPTMKRDVKIMRTVESFHSMVRVLLTDATERDQFFKEEFPVDYGPKFDQELEKLLWEFLIRLDQLLPVPSLAQTVSWLSDAPPVLEECARAATQPQLLKILLEHQTCLGHLETAASLPPNMGDSILASLSLAPSGKVPSNQPTVGDKSAADKSDGTQKRNEGPVITPVIGLISNEDVPALMSANKKTNEHLEENLKFTVVKQRQNPKHGGEQAEEESNDSKRSSGMKRKQPDERESEEEEEEEEVLAMNRPGAKRLSKSFRSGASGLGQGRGEQGAEEDVRNEECNRAVLETRVAQLVVNKLRLPEDPSLCSIFVSCLSSQPRVVIEKLQVTSAGSNCSGRGGKSLYTKQQNQGRKSAVKAPTRRSASDQLQKPDSDFLGPDDKENHPVLPSISSSPSQQRRNTETLVLPGDGEDYVADSEDEATKNFKGRLFMKRYYKTKHGTYVPTLREYWKPGMTRRDLTSTGSKHR
ncbi:TERF1-interacting nuclear factor 2 [Dicentrarchus labrax]|uniref:TERF1-interacting nuclear factor 2 n=1 Tax=Dicentrarchus labrax TaxID=13489 RepID=UPI0021F53B27|nr:TERF1-interacting nuclear factor 2 [Dicentrarchus labrax]